MSSLNIGRERQNQFKLRKSAKIVAFLQFNIRGNMLVQATKLCTFDQIYSDNINIIIYIYYIRIKFI